MDLQTIRQLVEPFITLVTYILLSGVGISAVTQFLKDSRIPFPASTYPRMTAAAGALIATLISLYIGDVNILLNSTWAWIGFGVSILLASALSYNILFKGLSSEKG